MSITEQGDAVASGHWKERPEKRGALAMLKKQGRNTITGRTGVVAAKMGRLSTVRLVIVIIGLLSMTTYVFYVRYFPARTQSQIPLQGDEEPLAQAQVDDSGPLPLGSFGCNSPAPPPVSISVGRSSAETDTPDLSTPAVAVYSVLSLIDQAATDKLAPCLFEGPEDPVRGLYPRYLGPPIELVDVMEDGDAAKVIWKATVHTRFVLAGKDRSPGESVILTTRLARVEGLWKLLRLHDGDEDDPR